MNLRAALFGLALLLSSSFAVSQEDYRTSLVRHREKRDNFLRKGSTSPLSLVHREYLKTELDLTIGGWTFADIRLPRAPHLQAVFGYEFYEGDLIRPVVRAVGSTFLTPIGEGPRKVLYPRTRPVFQLGDYILHYRESGLAQGAALDVYDLKSPAKVAFRGLEFFPITETYRVQAQFVPLPSPQKIELVDSQGFDRPYWIYGHLAFRLDGKDLRLEVYAATLNVKEIERDGFMLIFADDTSGEETYTAGRYLDIAGVRSGAVEVDFNKARNPPCNFSPVFTCPFPRKQNRLTAPIRAGEKKYTGPTARPLGQP